MEPCLESFEAENEDLIVARKLLFVGSGADYLYLRKGEDVSAVLTALEYLAVIGATAVSINHAWKYALDELELFKENLNRTKKLFDRVRDKLTSKKVEETRSKRINDFRIICTPDEENQKAIALFQLAGVRIRHRPQGVASGSHRFYLSDKKCAFFCRMDGGRFLGVSGYDPDLQKHLKEAFLEEWEKYGPDVLV